MKVLNSLLMLGSKMNAKSTTALGTRLSASELRKLPPAERDALLKAAAAVAEAEYRNNPELTAFDAFGKDDLYAESSNSESR
jgi:hypothetical protein